MISPSEYRRIIETYLGIKSEIYLGIEDLTVDRNLAIASGQEVNVNNLTIKANKTLFNYGVLRVYGNIVTEEGGRLVNGEGGEIIRVV